MNNVRGLPGDFAPGFAVPNFSKIDIVADLIVFVAVVPIGGFFQRTVRFVGAMLGSVCTVIECGHGKLLLAMIPRDGG